LIGNPACTTEQVEFALHRFGKENSVRVLKALSGNPRAPGNILLKIAEDTSNPNAEWLPDLAKNVSLPEEGALTLVKKCGSGTPHLAKSLASRPSLPMAAFVRLWDMRDIDVQEIILSSWRLDDMPMDTILRTSSFVLAAASNRQASGELLRSLWAWKDDRVYLTKDVRRVLKRFRLELPLALARHPNTPEDILEELRADLRYHVRKAMEVRP
jgi:hypothetical protein